MFVQVIQGTASDPAQFARQARSWQEQLRPSAIGFLGSTVGVTGDGTAFILARFENEELARANSQRPEQDAWWNETQKLFIGDVAFSDTSDVTLMGSGGSDSAGFVQIMKGRVKDKARFVAIMEQSMPEMEKMRPDIIGGLIAWVGDSQYIEAIYFASEAEARQGEASMTGAEMTPEMAEFMELADGPTEYFDLSDPILNPA